MTPPWVERMEAASRSPADWIRRSDEIRTQVLTAAGLWPEPRRSPVRAEVWGLFERDGYTVEKVLIETLPGFKLAANLFRPAGPRGWRPGVLSFHGHWKDGRFTERDASSLPGRSIGLARLGFVVLMTDMVGYGDTTSLPHDFGDVPWGLSLLGLQLWNNIRCLDFLESLPGVDPGRLGVTGASGGATQTFLLSAADNRVACAVPVNMVTAGCQGGCRCENAPLLRIDLNNVEMAAAMAPRPLMVISCTGDWTSKMEQRDAPFVSRAYAALGRPDAFRAATVSADHNYNRDSRELAYAWLARWLLGAPAADRIPEAPFVPLSKRELTVRDRGHAWPRGQSDAPALARALRARRRSTMEAIVPAGRASLRAFRAAGLPAMRATMAARLPDPAELEIREEAVEYRRLPGAVRVRRDGPGSVISVVTEADSEGFRGDGLTVVLGAPGREAPVNTDADCETEEWIQWRESHPLTYYRTGLARRVQDVLTAVAAFGGPGVRLEGAGGAGIAVLLARSLLPRGAIGPTSADIGGFDRTGFRSGDPGLPGILGIGGLATAAMLCAPGELELRGAGRLDAAGIEAAYRAAGRPEALTITK